MINSLSRLGHIAVRVQHLYIRVILARDDFRKHDQTCAYKYPGSILPSAKRHVRKNLVRIVRTVRALKIGTSDIGWV